VSLLNDQTASTIDKAHQTTGCRYQLVGTPQLQPDSIPSL